MVLYAVQNKKKQKVKTQGLQRQIKENQCFYENVWCVAVKS